jgi:hypothetical protein
METLFSTQYLHIFLHTTTHKTLELQWLDFVPSADYRASIEELMRLAHQHHAVALIGGKPTCTGAASWYLGG